MGGAKAFRLKSVPAAQDWLAVMRAVERAAADSLERLDLLEKLYRDAQRALAREYRPGALPALLALTHHRPLLSPQSVATTLGLSVAGASKLLERAAATRLLVEVTTRRSWRIFLARDLASDFGFIARARGRPPKEPPSLPADRDLARVFDAFDEQMAEIDRLLGNRTTSLDA